MEFKLCFVFTSYMFLMLFSFKKLTLLCSALLLFAFGSHDLDKFFHGKETFKSNGSFYITVSDNNLEFKVPAVEGATTQSVLAGSNIQLSESDLLTPDFETALSPGSKIIIQRAILVKIVSDGSEKEINVFGSTVDDALLESGIKLGELDRTEPGLKKIIYSNIEIKVIRVTQETIPEEFEITYQTVEKLNNQISYGKTKIIQAGEKGKEIKTFKITYEDGEEIARELISQEVVKEPRAEIVEKGTKITIDRVQIGVASWYARGLYNPQAMTAASRDFPRGTFLKVTNLANDKSVIVKVNDYVVNPKVIIDLSSGAFKKISSLGIGKIEVRVGEIL